MRPNYDQLPTAEWTQEEALHHLTQTFDGAVKLHPDLMERFVVMLVEAEVAEHKQIMRQGLRETFSERHPPQPPIQMKNAQGSA